MKFLTSITGGRNEIQRQKSKAIAAGLRCKGWTDESKLSLLFDLVKKTQDLDGDILEIGSAWGRSTVVIGLASGRIIWSIDPHTGGLAYMQKGESQNSYEEFLRNLENNAIRDRVKIVRFTTQEAATRNLLSPDTRFFFVFIDGLHTADGVKADIDFAYDRLVAGGVMAFDDYFEPTVKDYSAMIDTMLEEKRVRIIRDADAKLVYFFKTPV